MACESIRRKREVFVDAELKFGRSLESRRRRRRRGLEQHVLQLGQGQVLHLLRTAKSADRRLRESAQVLLKMLQAPARQVHGLPREDAVLALTNRFRFYFVGYRHNSVLNRGILFLFLQNLHLPSVLI